MDVIPVIDLKGGQVVHARAGERQAYRPIRTPLSQTSAPEDVVGGLLGLFPFARLYIADLDAILGEGGNEPAIAAIASRYPALEIWVDNGVADEHAAAAWLARNGAHLVIGSESQAGIGLIHALRRDRRVVLSLDFRGDGLLGPGALLEQPGLWPDRVIVMTLARVGAAAGPDFERIADIAGRASGRRVYAAGGVRDAADLRALAASGCAGALVATALHAGQITRTDLG